MENNITFPLTGGAVGAGIYSTIGGVGIVGGFGGIGIGLVGMTATGAVVGSAIYGAAQGIGDGDSSAFAAMGLGAIGGAGIASTIGGVGISFGGSAFGIGVGSMTAMGGVFGLGIYGLAKMFANSSNTKEPIGTTFNRMEEKISYMEAYCQAMMELNPLFSDLLWEQQFAELEIDEELKTLKAQIKAKNQFNLKWNIYNKSFEFNSENIEDTYFHATPNSVKIELQEKFTWQSIRTLSGHIRTINSFATKNNILASASDDNTISLWNIDTGRQIYSFFEPQEVHSVAINNRILVAGGFSKKITSWKLNNNTLEHIFSKEQHSNNHKNAIYDLIFNNRGDLVMSGSADQTIKIWNSATGSLKVTLNGHSGSINALSISPCDRFLISGSVDQTIRIWDLTTPFAKPQIINGHSQAVTAIAITPDGNYFVSASRDKSIKLWCIKTYKCIHIFENQTDQVNSIAISPDSKTIAIASSDGIVQLWNLVTKEISQTINACSPVIFSDNGKYLITGNSHNRIEIWQKIVDNCPLNHKSYLSTKWWEILGIERNSQPTNIKAAYYNLARQYHPDINSSQQAKEIMSIINQAYQESQINF